MEGLSGKDAQGRRAGQGQPSSSSDTGGSSVGRGLGWWKMLITEKRPLERRKSKVIKAKAGVCFLLIRRTWSTGLLLRG